MPAVSKKQQKFFGIVRAIQKGKMAPTTPETAKAAADMKKGDVKKFASTKHKGLPEKKKPTFKESAFTNITVGNKVGQTFQHASGATITLDNTMSDPSDLPSQVTIDLGFGDFLTVPAPSTNEYGIAGITSSLGNAGGGGGVQTRQRTKTAAEINLQLDASKKASGAETAKVGEIKDPLKFSDQTPYEAEYQMPGSKEYKDMQRVSFDEYYKTLTNDHDYNKVLMGNPESRWKLMRYWATQHDDRGNRKAAMNLSRIKALKTVLDPATGKPYDFASTYWHGKADTQLGEYVREKLKNIGQIHFDHNYLGSSVPYPDLVSKVLSKGAPALDVYLEELNVFEKHMTQVNNLLEKDLKEYKTYLRKQRYKTSSEIQRITYKQAENLKIYQDKLNDIKDHKGHISRIIPGIKNAFAGNFEPTPISTPTKPSASPEAEKAAVDKAYKDVGKGDLEDYEKLPPGLLKAVVEGETPDVESVLSPTQLTKLQRLPLEAKTFLKYLTNKLPPVLNNDYMGKDFVRHAFSVAGFVDYGKGVKVGDNIIGSGQQLTYDKKTNQVTLKFTYDFKKSVDEYAEPRYQNMNKAALLVTAYADALTGGEYGADARGLITSPLAAGWWIQISKALGGGKSTPGEITISLDELSKINSTMANDVKSRYNLIGKKKNDQGTFDKDGNYIPPGFEKAIGTDKITSDLGSAGAVGGVDATAAATAAATTKKKKKKVNESKLSFELIQQFREGLNPDRLKKLKEQTTFAQMQQRIRDAKEKRREQQKKSEKLYMDTKRKGVKFYDKKGTGRLKDGKKIYD